MKHFIYTATLILVSVMGAISQNEPDKFWARVNETTIIVSGARQIIPNKYQTFKIVSNELKFKLFSAPHEKRTKINLSSTIITLPLPNGAFQRFRVVESPIMEEGLVASFPNIKTFSVRGIDDVYASGKLDWTEFGFHAMILSPEGDFFIDPYCVGNTADYITYYTKDFTKPRDQIIPEAGLLTSKINENQINMGSSITERPFAKTSVAAACVGSDLRTYRLAIACTGQYAVAATGQSNPTNAQALAKVVTTVNRVDGIFEKEVAVRLELVASTTLVLYTVLPTGTAITPAPTATNQPFTGNNNANTLINESQSVITNQIGSANFDIGHTFSTGGGGLAQLGCVCNNAEKAEGITGSPNPVGDPYDIDYVAHEIGHQFKGNHTFNATTGNCNNNRNGATSVEPGSGVTIMGYASLCGTNDIASNSIPYFHAISYDEIVNFTNSLQGKSCAVTTTTGNQPPVVSGLTNYVVPISTPFYLTGSAIDPDGDAITYSWEETDLGAGIGGNWNSGNKPYFRSYAPIVSDTRFFPNVTVAASGNFTGTRGEYLPTSAQVLNFRLTVRDNKMGGGGVCHASNTITIDPSGPLMVTYPSETNIFWYTTSQKTITWDVNGTNSGPVGCDSVRILISNNAGGTYSVLVNSTLNDGDELITVPTVTLTTKSCRIKIECIGKIFYDIGNNNFTISTDPAANVRQVSANNSLGLSVWPNPFKDGFNFSVNNLNSQSLTQLQVVDVLGKVVLQYNYANKNQLKETVDVSELSSGIYFIKLSNNNNQSVYRVVKH